MNTSWIKDRVTIVTGGASGIGEGIALEAAAAGSVVVIADINKSKGKDVETTIRKEGYQAHYINTDVTNSESISALIRAAKSFGPVKFLVNSAGLQTYGTAESTTEEIWDRTMDVNLKSMFLMAHQAIPEILENGGGAIVNISSVQGLVSQKNVTAYATSKAAAIGLTRCMGLDYSSKGIRINCICPGSIDTPMLRYGAAKHGDLEEVLKEWGNHHPIGRIGTPKEIAETAMFLLSPAASFIVGQAIVADGGLGSVIL